MPGGEALTLAVLTHGLKFAYSFALGAPLTLLAFSGLPSLGRIRASREDSKRAGRFEIVAARLWNVLNEGKPFTPVFVAGTLVLLGIPQLTDGGYWLRQLIALAALLPLFALFYRYAFPLRLRAGLWVLLAACLALFRVFDPAAIALVLALYLGFTVVLWGSIYYHLRIGTPWTNGLRFWRLVLENPDPTSGNSMEQVPKLESTDRSLTGRAAGLPERSAGVPAFAGRCRSEEPSLSVAQRGSGALRAPARGCARRARACWREPRTRVGAVSERQAGSGNARNRARAAAHWPAQGQRFARCRVQRRAEWVSRPARAK